MAKFIEILADVAGKTIDVVSTSFCEVGDTFTNPTLVTIPFVGRNNKFGVARAIVAEQDVNAIDEVVKDLKDLDDTIPEDVATAKILCGQLPKRIWLKSLYKTFTNIMVEEDANGKLTGAKRSVSEKPQGTFAEGMRAAYKGGKQTDEVQAIIDDIAKTDRKKSGKFIKEIICTKAYTAENKDGKSFPVVAYMVANKDVVEG